MPDCSRGGLFEWQQINNIKIPWYITLKSGEPFVFAGLCDSWRIPLNGEEVKSCSLITIKANSLMEHIQSARVSLPAKLIPLIRA